MLTFLWPWAFWLLPLPFLAYKLIPRSGKQEAALFVPFFADIISFDQQNELSPGSGVFKGLYLLLIWSLLIGAVSRPQWVGEPIALPAVGRDLMLAVDISGSMKAEDMFVDRQQVSRLVLVKKVVNEFIERRIGDRVGLLLFGTEAYIQAPMTFDRQTVRTLLHEAQIGFAGEKTSIGDAMGLAIKRLKDRPDENRILILLTDGSNTAGSVEPLVAAQLAAQTGVKVYTIGVGADEMMVRDFLFTRRINPAADLDEDTLRKIAELTGGKYFRARNTGELEEIYQIIDKLEPLQQESEIFRPVKTLFYLPLAGALVLSFLLGVMMLLRSGFKKEWTVK